jgi:hypothetical protein
MKSKKFELLFAFCMISLLIIISQPVRGAGASYSVPIGTTVAYTGSASSSYQMYSSSVTITVTDNTTYPLKGNLQYQSGNKPTTPNADLIPYFVNASNWDVNATNSPFYGVPDVDPNSPFITNWTAEHLTFKDTENNIYNNQIRNVTYFHFSYNYTSQGDLFQASCSYRWDMEFGVLLEYQINFTDFNDFAYDGSIDMAMSSTSLWGLPLGGGIAGYSPCFIALISTCIIAGLWIHMRKRNLSTTLKGGN